MKFFNPKSTTLIAALSMCAVLISSCKKDPEPTPVVYGDAKISVTNTVTGSNAQDFYQNDTKISTAAVAYGETSGLYVVKAGNSTISFKDAGTTTVKATLPVGLETDISYTGFYYVDPAGSFKITGFGNDNVPPAIGKYKVRFVNLGSQLTNPLRAGINGGNALISELGFGNATAYFTVEVGSPVEIAVLNTTKVTAIPTATFLSGKIYTVWVNGKDFTADYHVIQHN